ncbi:hypothetical protein BKA81DRAFT_377193 [Phyllosticta paracitricarpa]
MSLRAEYLDYIDSIQSNSDSVMLNKDSPHRNNEHLCMGWLVLQFHSNARSIDGTVDEDEYKTARSKITYKIGAREHLMWFEETLGAEVFLLFVKTWKRMPPTCRVAIVNEFHCKVCPNLPELLDHLRPVFLQLDYMGSSITSFGFEARGAFKTKPLSLATLMQAENPRLAIKDHADDADEDVE